MSNEHGGLEEVLANFSNMFVMDIDLNLLVASKVLSVASAFDYSMKCPFRC